MARAQRDCCLAAFSGQSCLALAGVSIYTIYTFKMRLFARVALTLVNINTTIDTCEARPADAVILLEPWHCAAGFIGGARVHSTRIIEEFTVRARVG